MTKLTQQKKNELQQVILLNSTPEQFSNYLSDEQPSPDVITQVLTKLQESNSVNANDAQIKKTYIESYNKDKHKPEPKLKNRTDRTILALKICMKIRHDIFSYINADKFKLKNYDDNFYTKDLLKIVLIVNK